MKHRRKLAKALENPEEAIRILEDYIGNSDSRMQSLQTKWDETRVPLEIQLRSLKEALGFSEESEKISAGIVGIRQKIDDLQDEAAAKLRQLTVLVRKRFYSCFIRFFFSRFSSRFRFIVFAIRF